LCFKGIEYDYEVLIFFLVFCSRNVFFFGYFQIWVLASSACLGLIDFVPFLSLKMSLIIHSDIYGLGLTDLFFSFIGFFLMDYFRKSFFFEIIYFYRVRNPFGIPRGFKTLIGLKTNVSSHVKVFPSFLFKKNPTTWGVPQVSGESFIGSPTVNILWKKQNGSTINRKKSKKMKNYYNLRNQIWNTSKTDAQNPITAQNLVLNRDWVA